MNWTELRAELLRMKEDGELENGIKLNKASTIVDPNKFIDSHIHYLDHQKAEKDAGRKINQRNVNSHYVRLLVYFEELMKNKKQK